MARVRCAGPCRSTSRIRSRRRSSKAPSARGRRSLRSSSRTTSCSTVRWTPKRTRPCCCIRRRRVPYHGSWERETAPSFLTARPGFFPPFAAPQAASHGQEGAIGCYVRRTAHTLLHLDLPRFLGVAWDFSPPAPSPSEVCDGKRLEASELVP